MHGTTTKGLLRGLYLIPTEGVPKMPGLDIDSPVALTENEMKVKTVAENQNSDRE